MSLSRLRVCAFLPLAVLACEGEPGYVARSTRSLERQAAASAEQPRPPAAPEPAVEPDLTEREDEPQSLRFPGEALDHDQILEQLATAEPSSFRAVGSTSTVFRTRLRGPVDAAFKASSVERPLGPVAEVAAYRLARCLRIGLVPPAVSRQMPLSQLEQLLSEEQGGRWSMIASRLGDVQQVSGAAIYWIRGLQDIGLDGPRGARRIERWLSLQGDIPAEERALAASTSTMIAFDYLIGNFDRWSGGNAKGTADGAQVVIRDHDLAFPARMHLGLHRRLWDRLRSVERFSAELYHGVKQLSRGCFELELARDPEGAAGRLLRQAQIDGVFDRREALLSHVEALIALHGEDRILMRD